VACNNVIARDPTDGVWMGKCKCRSFWKQRHFN
jgi:hypothetical protein